MKRILFVASPVVVSLIVLVLLNFLIDPEIVLVIRIGLGWIALFLGMLISILAFISQWAHNRGEQASSLQAEQRRRTFIRHLDHELKNPLTGLRAALANLSESDSPNDRVRATSNARRDAERLYRLLADLRKLSDLDEMALERIPIQVPGMLEDIVEAASHLPAYRDRPVSLLIANIPPLPPVIGDRDLLGLAFYNLIENALKYTGPGHAVQVRAREDGRSVVVEVADSGPGISPEDIPHLFEELYRGANARGVEGSGLGLALADRIVVLHGGRLRVASQQGERQGTVFSIHLPAARGG